MDMKLKRLLEEVLGNSGNTDAKGNTQFYCPASGCNHRKRKLEVNTDKESENYQKYHCWVCNLRGAKLMNLLKIAKASREQIKKLAGILGTKIQTTTENISNINFNDNETKTEDSIQLPKDFHPLYKKQKTIDYKNALRFIKSRGFSSFDILKYNIGYCSMGPYKSRVIIPSYDCSGKLNYYTGRDIYPNSKLKYKNPQASKDVVMFGMFINWQYPINICEGVFDAVTIRINSIPIMGKTLSSSLLEKIKHYKPKVNIILDNDAQKDAYTIGSMLANDGIEVNVVELPKGKDPNELGFTKVWKLINKSKSQDSSDLYKEEILAKLL